MKRFKLSARVDDKVLAASANVSSEDFRKDLRSWLEKKRGGIQVSRALFPPEQLKAQPLASTPTPQQSQQVPLRESTYADHEDNYGPLPTFGAPAGQTIGGPSGGDTASAQVEAEGSGVGEGTPRTSTEDIQLASFIEQKVAEAAMVHKRRVQMQERLEKEHEDREPTSYEALSEVRKSEGGDDGGEDDELEPYAAFLDKFLQEQNKKKQQDKGKEKVKEGSQAQQQLTMSAGVSEVTPYENLTQEDEGGVGGVGASPTAGQEVSIKDIEVEEKGLRDCFDARFRPLPRDHEGGQEWRSASIPGASGTFLLSPPPFSSPSALF